MEIYIRPAEASDLPALLEIINHNILHTTALYDYTPKTAEHISQWFADKQQGRWPVIVATENEKLIGYATYGSFRPKEANKFTVEHSVYAHPEHSGKGIGKLLMAELIELARKQGYHTMIGCIDAENTSSIEFHKKFGFTETGILRQVAYKFNRWLDLQFMQLML